MRTAWGHKQDSAVPCRTQPQWHTFLILCVSFSLFAVIAPHQSFAQPKHTPAARTLAEIPSSEFGGGDPARFQSCEMQKDKLAESVCRVGAAAFGAALISAFYSAEADKTHYFAAFAALEALNISQMMLSSARYGFRAEVSNYRLAPKDLAECLGNWLGICGNHVEFFLHIMHELGLKARPLQFYYEVRGRRHSHIAAEVFYAGGWRYFDVTWGAVFPSGRHLLFHSYAEIKAQRDAKPAVNENNTWYSIRAFVQEDAFEYLRAEPKSVLFGMIGVIRFSSPALSGAITNSEPFVEAFNDVPNYIGDNQADGQRAGVRFEVAVKGRNRVRIETIATGCENTVGNFINVGKNRVPIATKVIDVFVDDTFNVEIETAQDVCYVVLKQMEIVRQ
jgi:hypothetical protein